MDYEGRILTLEFDNYYVTQVYTPNSGNELKRLEDRQIWDEKYTEYLQKLDKSKPVIASGDYNVAHTPIDLKHPENNHHNLLLMKKDKILISYSNSFLIHLEKFMAILKESILGGLKEWEPARLITQAGELTIILFLIELLIR